MGEIADLILECSRLKQETTELKSQLEALQAHVERLHEHIKCAGSSAWGADEAEKLIEEAPQQSLNHIEARVEEETIAADISYMYHNGNTPGCVAKILKNRPRKYAKQEKKEGE